MCSATALPKDTSLQGMENRLRERLKEIKRNSLGSEYVAFHAGRDEVIALAESELVNAFRRVVLDPVRGLVMLMSPSGGHETTSGFMDDFVGCASKLKGVVTEKLRATRWRRLRLTRRSTCPDSHRRTSSGLYNYGPESHWIISKFMKQSASCWRGMHWRFARKRRSTS